jgi:hypothetical protein
MAIPPPTRRKDTPLMLPRTEDFDRLLYIGTSLSSIVGMGTIPVADLERWSSSLWANPAIFTECLCSSRETKSDTDVAHAVVALMETIPDRKDKAWKLLWTVEKGYTRQVKSRVPPDLTEVNERALLLDVMLANEEKKAKSVTKETTDDEIGPPDHPTWQDVHGTGPGKARRQRPIGSLGVTDPTTIPFPTIWTSLTTKFLPNVGEGVVFQGPVTAQAQGSRRRGRDPRGGGGGCRTREEIVVVSDLPPRPALGRTHRQHRSRSGGGSTVSVSTRNLSDSCHP